MRVLASADGETAAYPALLAAIGGSLGCAGALWLARRGRRLHCAATWPADAAVAAELAAGVWEDGRPAARARTRRSPSRFRAWA